jgi:hypothetical protein
MGILRVDAEACSSCVGLAERRSEPPRRYGTGKIIALFTKDIAEKDPIPNEFSEQKHWAIMPD